MLVLKWGAHRYWAYGRYVVLAVEEAHCEQRVGEPCLEDVWGGFNVDVIQEFTTHQGDP